MRTQTTHTDCRTDEGIAVGLIDGIIAQARVLRKMDLSGKAIEAALKDMRSDEDVLYLVGIRKVRDYTETNGKNMAKMIKSEFQKIWKEKQKPPISHDISTDT